MAKSRRYHTSRRNVSFRKVFAELDAKAFASSKAIVGALTILAIGLIGRTGHLTYVVDILQRVLLFFDLTYTGIAAGVIQVAILAYICGLLFATLYNKMSI